MSTLVGLISIPTIIATVGAGTWGIIALGQSLALLMGVLVSFGWGTTGPAVVAGLPAADRPQMFVNSFVSRIYLFLAALPITALIIAFTAETTWSVVALASVTYLVPFLGAAWYFIGEGKPRKLFLMDTVPISAGTLLGLAALLVTRDAHFFLLCQLLMNCLAVVLSVRTISREEPEAVVVDPHPGRAIRRLGGQRHGVITAATSSLYVNTPLIVLSVAAPGGIPLYALADRFFKYGLTALGPVIQVLQGSIPSPDSRVRNRRVRSTVRWAPIAGLAAAVVAAAVMPWAGTVLSSGQIPIPFGMSLPMALVFGSVAVSQAIGLACLIPIGKGRSLVNSTVLGALLGTPLILVGAYLLGPIGVAWAVAFSEAVVAGYQIVVVRRYLAENDD
ncbi:hypothetical protein ACX80N_12725 [Arthrobacter sp. MDT2-16]